MELTRRILERAGYTVRCAEGVSGARERLMDQKPDGIILDSELTDGNALDFCREIRDNSEIPVLFVSFSKDDEIAAMHAGSSDFLKRPTDYAVLKSRLSVMLHKRATHPANEHKTPAKNEDHSKAKAKSHQSEIAATSTASLDDSSDKPHAESAGHRRHADKAVHKRHSDGADDKNGKSHAESISAPRKRSGQSNPMYLMVAGIACLVFVVVGLALLYSQGGIKPIVEIDRQEEPLVFADVSPITDDDGKTTWPNQIQFYERTVIPAGSRDVDMKLPNPSSNRRYFTFELTLDTGETLYKSGLVVPGKCIDGFTLNRTLPIGLYKADLIICAYDAETLTEAARATASLDISVE